MFPLLHWLSARHWRQHPIRAALTLIGVSLGVAVTLAVNLIGTEIQMSHRRSLEYIAGKAELTVSAGETGMSREVTDRIAAVDGVAHVDPLLEKVLIEPGKGPVVCWAWTSSATMPCVRSRLARATRKFSRIRSRS
jgi:putative ABC transport system permease protein